MAIDTRERRQSCCGIQVTLLPGMTPNASPDVEWRQESGWGYPGIAPVGAAAFKVYWALGSNILLDGSEAHV
jgi:hypothetical protein